MYQSKIYSAVLCGSVCVHISEIHIDWFFYMLIFKNFNHCFLDLFPCYTYNSASVFSTVAELTRQDLRTYSSLDIQGVSSFG